MTFLPYKNLPIKAS